MEHNLLSQLFEYTGVNQGLYACFTDREISNLFQTNRHIQTSICNTIESLRVTWEAWKSWKSTRFPRVRSLCLLPTRVQHSIEDAYLDASRFPCLTALSCTSVLPAHNALWWKGRIPTLRRVSLSLSPSLQEKEEKDTEDFKTQELYKRWNEQSDVTGCTDLCLVGTEGLFAQKWIDQVSPTVHSFVVHAKSARIRLSSASLEFVSVKYAQCVDILHVCRLRVLQVAHASVLKFGKECVDTFPCLEQCELEEIDQTYGWTARFDSTTTPSLQCLQCKEIGWPKEDHLEIRGVSELETLDLSVSQSHNSVTVSGLPKLRDCRVVYANYVELHLEGSLERCVVVHSLGTALFCPVASNVLTIGRCLFQNVHHLRMDSGMQIQTLRLENLFGGLPTTVDSVHTLIWYQPTWSKFQTALACCSQTLRECYLLEPKEEEEEEEEEWWSVSDAQTLHTLGIQCSPGHLISCARLPHLQTLCILSKGAVYVEGEDLPQLQFLCLPPDADWVPSGNTDASVLPRSDCVGCFTLDIMEEE